MWSYVLAAYLSARRSLVWPEVDYDPAEHTDGKCGEPQAVVLQRESRKKFSSTSGYIEVLMALPGQN